MKLNVMYLSFVFYHPETGHMIGWNIKAIVCINQFQCSVVKLNQQMHNIQFFM
jgi:hypothetical protein